MKKHKRDMPSEGRSMLDMGFTPAGGGGAAGLSTDAEMDIEESASFILNMDQPDECVAAHTEEKHGDLLVVVNQVGEYLSSTHDAIIFSRPSTSEIIKYSYLR